MDSLLRYIINKGKAKERLFVSLPPGPVPLIWCSFHHSIKIAGVTVVRSTSWIEESGISHAKLMEVLKNQIPSLLPVVDIQYNHDCSEFVINGQRLNASEAAHFIASTLKISLGNSLAKKANVGSQITDAFHIWSRNVFDGITVRKLDIDALTLTEDLTSIKALIEVKRSNKNPIGRWLPYMALQGNSDYWNYIIAFTFCKIIKCDFVTFHHEIMDSSIEFKDDFKIEQFWFHFPTIISPETINHFAEGKTKITINAKDLI